MYCPPLQTVAADGERTSSRYLRPPHTRKGGTFAYSLLCTLAPCYARGPTRRAYSGDVSDDEWAFVAPYLTCDAREDAPQRDYSPRDLFDGLRYINRTGVQWRFMPNDLPPWSAVYQQTQRWLRAGVFEAMVSDLRSLMRAI